MGIVYSPVVTEVITGITVCRQECGRRNCLPWLVLYIANSPRDGSSGKLLAYQSQTSEKGKPGHKTEVTI